MVIRCGGHHERVCLLSCNCQAFSIGSQIARVIAKYSSFPLMSLSKGLNADESKMLRSLLQRAHENGSLNVFLPTLGSETSDWSEVESLEEDMSAAMNDASKRRLVSPDRLDAKHGQRPDQAAFKQSCTGCWNKVSDRGELSED